MNKQWNDRIPEDIRPAAGLVKVPALNALLNKFGLGGLKWSSQFISGFDIYGSFSQDQAYFPTMEVAVPQESLEEVFNSLIPRFATRAPRKVKDSDTIWAEAASQIREGILSPLIHADALEFRVDPEGYKIGNVHFRFGVSQTG